MDTPSKYTLSLIGSTTFWICLHLTDVNYLFAQPIDFLTFFIKTHKQTIY